METTCGHANNVPACVTRTCVISVASRNFGNASFLKQKLKIAQSKRMAGSVVSKVNSIWA